MQRAKTYQIPPFITEPVGCQVKMKFTRVYPYEAIELTEFDDTLNEFTFGISDDI